MNALSVKWRPKFLHELVGQPEVAKLRAFAAKPYPSCWCLEGMPGIGKTSAAYALAGDLGCLREDCPMPEMTGLYAMTAADLGVETAKKLFGETLRLRPMMGSGWRMLILEELEFLSPQCCIYLKVALETQLPPSTVVVATSNDTSKLQPALRQRFRTIYLQSGPPFAEACQPTLLEIWNIETDGAPIPTEWPSWGWWDQDCWSFRSALDEMEQYLLTMEEDQPCLKIA